MRKIFVIAILFLLSFISSSFAEERFFEIRAKKFSYDPNIIKVRAGEEVKVRLISEDVTHGFYLDGYELDTKAHPGEEGYLTFTADKRGKFVFRCSITCGEFHPYMVGYLIVEPNTRFFSFVFLTIFLGLASIAVILATRGDRTDKLFGLVDLSWRFELTKFKPIRRLFESRWFPLLLLIFNLFIFVIILIAGFIGGYSAGNYNFGIMIVWILWWVLLMLFLVPGFSRAWCLMCPFPIFSDWFQRKKLFGVQRGKLSGLNLKWPRFLRNMWIMNIGFLITTFFSGFFTVRPFATFVLLGGIILLAFIIGLIFEKRSFCLYICPVSGFQGLYSQFAASEIRRKDPEVCRKHMLKTCFVGDEKGHGCPWLLTPFDFKKNTYCGMCMECFKTCPYANMGFFLRPPGVDLLVDTKREPKGFDEAWKAFIMLGIAMMFYLAFQGPWGFIKDMVRATTLRGFLGFISLHTVFNLLIIPLIFFVFVYLSKLFSGNREVALKKVFINFAYTLIPLGLGVWIAFSLGIILPNGSYILHVLSDPFAWGWNLLGTANFPWTPVFTGVLGYLQGGTLIIFYLFSIAYGFRLSKLVYPDLNQAKRGWFPILFFLTLVTILFLWLYMG